MLGSLTGERDQERRTRLYTKKRPVVMSLDGWISYRRMTREMKKTMVYVNEDSSAWKHVQDRRGTESQKIKAKENQMVRRLNISLCRSCPIRTKP